eukprot:sb/3474495/
MLEIYGSHWHTLQALQDEGPGRNVDDSCVDNTGTDRIRKYWFLIGCSPATNFVTPLGAARVFICASESCFGSQAFVSGPIWSNQNFTDSQNYALSGDIRFLPKTESKWGLSRANTTPRDKRGVTTSKNPTLPCVLM